MTLLYRAKSSGDWCKVLLVAADEALDSEDVGSNMTEPGDKIDIAFVLLPESFDSLHNQI